ncbi:MAG: diaminopimelate decarboxylase [Gammaproteobacteria bacterium]|nr:diaminopimelate decarboxylase [Gammaproteobacteria bacterium]
MPLRRVNGTLQIDDIPIPKIVEFVGTPVYAYSWQTLEERYHWFESCFSGIPHRTHYAVKANSNLAILRRLAELGAGFDIVSGGELERVLRSGAPPAHVVYSGVGKSTEELSFALKTGIGCINVESTSEFDRVSQLGKTLNIRPNIAFRVNPEIDADTNPYLATALSNSKFGLSEKEVLETACRSKSSPHINVIGVACHLGSQISSVNPYGTAIADLLKLVDQLQEIGMDLHYINVGGGFGISYDLEKELQIAELASVLSKQLANRSQVLCLEPGRFLIGPAGTLISRVEYLKVNDQNTRPNFAVVDAAMNDLIRPALYKARHDIEIVLDSNAPCKKWNIVGPVCESADFLGLDRLLSISEGDLIAIKDVGAYGFVQSSNYNSRTRVAEVLVDGSKMNLIRERETMDDQLRRERFA